MDRALTEHWISRIAECPSALRGRDIVLLSHQRWGAHFTPIHGTALRLAQHNRVLYMEPPDSAALLLKERAARAALLRTFNRMDRYGDNFAVYNVPPLFLPFQPYSRLIMRSITRSYAGMVRDGVRRMGLREPFLWIFQFNTIGVAKALAPAPTVYESVEEISEFARRERVRRFIREMDARLCRYADVVIVPNEHMRATRAEMSRAIHVLPWPVDVDHYGDAMNPAVSVPDEITALAKPVIGFYGNIDARRFDVSLVLEIARRHPDWSLVLIGGFWPGFDPSPLLAQKNIHCLGQRPLAELPACVKGFDVSIIPYMVNELTRSITPLKLMEYLATGRPVVSTPLPAAQAHADVIRVARNVDEFEAALSAAIADPDTNRDERLRVARAHDWAQYMEKKTTIAAEMLANRAARAADRGQR